MIKSVEIPLAGHADKICDQIVDAILDEYLRRDPKSRVDIQALGSHGMLMIGGTVDSRADFDVATIARQVYASIGFSDDIEPFVNIERPGEDISKSIVNGGAQGTAIVYGYATRKTREFLPKPLVYANAIARRLRDLRIVDDAGGEFLLPDGKVQLSMDGNNVQSVSVSVQHTEDASPNDLKSFIVDRAILPVIGSEEKTKYFVNVAGSFTTGGFESGGGVSGRKEVSDTYGGLLPHGGAGFTGKDPLHPARAGQYMARFVAKKLVAEGVSGNVFISVAYTIGQKEPVFVEAKTGEGKDISQMVRDNYDFRAEAIVERLDLLKPMYGDVAIFGQFGRGDLPWEQVS